ncbi:MAG: hypothetical protein ACKOZN_04795, partial [Cyanobium sp.]
LNENAKLRGISMFYPAVWGMCIERSRSEAGRDLSIETSLSSRLLYPDVGMRSLSFKVVSKTNKRLHPENQ